MEVLLHAFATTASIDTMLRHNSKHFHNIIVSTSQTITPVVTWHTAQLNCWTLARSQLDTTIPHVPDPSRLQKITIFVPINLFCTKGSHLTPLKSIHPAEGRPVLNRAVLFKCLLICVSLNIPSQLISKGCVYMALPGGSPARLQLRSSCRPTVQTSCLQPILGPRPLLLRPRASLQGGVCPLSSATAAEGTCTCPATTHLPSLPPGSGCVFLCTYCHDHSGRQLQQQQEPGHPFPQLASSCITVRLSCR